MYRKTAFLVLLCVAALLLYAGRKILFDSPVVPASSDAPYRGAKPEIASASRTPIRRFPSIAKEAPHVDVPTEQSDEQRATRTFDKFRQCHVVSAKINHWRELINACNFAARAQGSYDALCKAQVREYDAKIQAQQSQLSDCGTVPATLERNYYDSVVNAAKLGDADAQICYIRGIFSLPDGLSRAEIERYKDDALNYIDQAFIRGDWRGVELLGTSSNYLAHDGGLMAALPIGDALTVYKANRLERLGAAGEYAERLDREKKDLVLKLSPDQIADAEDWASSNFAAHFAKSPALTRAPDACVDVPATED